MYRDNEDATGINSKCVRVCLFLGNLYRIEQQGAYGEIKGLRERERERRKRMMDSLEKVRVVCVCRRSGESERQLLEIFSHLIRIILTPHSLLSLHGNPTATLLPLQSLP